MLVEVDNNTFQELTRLHRHAEWPFPRRYDAEVIDRVRAAGAQTIAMDIEFAHATDEADDHALFEALGRAHGKTVLAATEVGPHGETEVLGGPNTSHEVGARAAEALLTPDSDGAVRRFAYSFHNLQSFPVVTSEVASGQHVAPSTFEHGMLPIDYAGPPGTFTSISYSKVLQGRIPAEPLPRQDRDRRSLGADPPGRPHDPHERVGRDAGTGNLGKRHLARCCAGCRCETCPAG